AETAVGAMGLMQLMPATAKEIATRLGETFEKEKLYSVNTNIKYGCYYIRYLLDMFGGDYVLALASYNAGFSNVKAWLKDVKCSVDGKHLSYIPFS
ncbi:MAG: lytic transglycosylase domain-containing protein, partial [Clostridia bacterium]|nr:lytic transglycosylase domain-containing protein [Clostridia bacterium]